MTRPLVRIAGKAPSSPFDAQLTRTECQSRGSHRTGSGSRRGVSLNQRGRRVLREAVGRRKDQIPFVTFGIRALPPRYPLSNGRAALAGQRS